MGNLNLRIENRIAFLEFDQPDSRVNLLNTETMRELAGIIAQLADKAHSKVKVLVITSKKDGIFIAGADIKEIEYIHSAEEAKEKAEKGKEVLNNLHNLDLITVAVINGACLGGGFELALACQYRVASFSDKVKLGLPEVKLGVIPGFGGTQRLPRLIGLTRALKMILTGETISGKEALKYGAVDKLFTETRLIEDSIDFINGLLKKKIHVKRKQKKKFLQLFFENTPLGRAILFSQAKKNIIKKTKGFYPAPLKAVELIRHTYGQDIRKGSLSESVAFGEVAITEVSKNLIKVFYLNEEFKKFPWVDTSIKPAPVHKCGVVGAGVMGGGIAQLVSFNDIPTRVKDINYKALGTALRTADELFAYALKKRKLKKHQVDYKFGLISPTITYRGFENADLVIEAVVEDLSIKQTVFKELSQIASPKTIFASNTSALPIIEMAEATNAPDRVIGLHFFNPVHRMPLVEVITSSKTSNETLSTVIAFARRLGKVVIVVKDVPGFLINRILLSYLNEAGFLIEEGMRIEHIDSIALKFGMPMGPLELIDEVGIDVGYKVAKILEQAYGFRMRVCSLLERVKSKDLLVDNSPRINAEDSPLAPYIPMDKSRGFTAPGGKKSKLGFYVHKGKKKIPNSNIYNLFQPSANKPIPDDTILKRMIYVMINEAARCLEEKVVDKPQTIDIGMLMGTRFPPFRAGLLRYADSLGIDTIVKELKDFEKDFNAVRFEPCKYLTDKAEKKENFY